MNTDCIDLVLAMFREPARIADMRERPLPDDVAKIIRLAAGEAQALESAIEASGEVEDTLIEASVFFLQQVLFAPTSDSYRVLGASSDSAQAHLRDNYRWLMKWLHPDRNQDGWEAVYADRVNMAWQDLKTTDRRTKYDEEQEFAPVATLSTDLALRPRVAQIAGAGPLLSGSTVRRLPTIILGTLGAFAVAVIVLMYWHQNETQRQLAASREVAVAIMETPGTAPDTLGSAASAYITPAAAPSTVDGQGLVPQEAASAQQVTLEVAPVELTDSKVLSGSAVSLASQADLQPLTEMVAHVVDPPVAIPHPDSPSMPEAKIDLVAQSSAAENSLVVAPLAQEPVVQQAPADGASGIQASVSRFPETKLPAAQVSVVSSTAPQVPIPPVPVVRVTAANAPAEQKPSAQAPVAKASSEQVAVARAPVVQVPVAQVQASKPAFVPSAAAPVKRLPAAADIVVSSQTEPGLAASVTKPAPQATKPQAQVASPSQSTVVVKAETHTATGQSTEPVAQLATASPAGARIAKAPADADARALVREFASAYAAGDLSRFDHLFSSANAQRTGESMRGRLSGTVMRYLEFEQLQLTPEALSIRARARYRDTYVPRGAKRAVTENGTMEWLIQLDNGAARIAELARVRAGS